MVAWQPHCAHATPRYHDPMTKLVRNLPHPADFQAPPSVADRARWGAADVAARPARLGRLRTRLAAEGVDAYFGMRPEHMRYLIGFALDDAEALALVGVYTGGVFCVKWTVGDVPAALNAQMYASGSACTSAIV